MDGAEIFMVFMMCVFFAVLIGGVVMLYDETFVRPIAADNANNHCNSLGFDQYKSFSRVGLLSEDPVGIKCEYAERYTDLGVRT